MPLIRSGSQIIYYAHVPKCAGSAVEHYLAERFGALAFVDTAYLSQKHPWSRTSPQHIDLPSLERILPDNFIDFSFSVVRHPVGRIVSTWHFQKEVEGTIPEGQKFGDWLADLAELMTESPFIYDNHVRPMTEIVPEGAEVFYLEHGLDAIIPWLDHATGKKAAPRFFAAVNERKKTGGAKVEPTSAELDIIQEIYQRDFERFGYKVSEKRPTVPAPDIAPEVLAEIGAARREAQTPVKDFLKKVRRRLRTD